MAIRLLTGWLLVGAAAMLAQAQTPNAGIAGSGLLSPSVVATYQGSGNMPAGPLTVDLLVLWRGSPGWFDERTGTSGGAGSDGVHVLKVASRTLQLRFDARTRTVNVHNHVIPLQHNNVLLLDAVDVPGGITVAGLLQVDGRLSPTTPGGLDADPMDTMVQRSPELFDYLRCDPRFANANDPFSDGQLRHCEQLRGLRPLF